MKKYNLITKIFIEYTENQKLIFFRYLFTGGAVTIINIILLYLLVEIVMLNYYLSNVISMLICIIITYIVSKKIVFSKKVSIRSKKGIYELCSDCNYFNYY